MYEFLKNKLDMSKSPSRIGPVKNFLKMDWNFPTKIDMSKRPSRIGPNFFFIKKLGEFSKKGPILDGF